MIKKYFSPSKERVQRQLNERKQKLQTTNKNRKAEYHRYFCHYNNAVYMGGMSSYKKHGKGLLLHDDGSSVITQYAHDTITGHNIIFRQNSIISLLYKNHVDYEIAFKFDKFIIKISFKDGNHIANGKGVLIDYRYYKIYHLIYRNGKLMKKNRILNKRINEQVFNKNNISQLIDAKHQSAFNLTFDLPTDCKIKFTNQKFTIGYFDQNKQIHGLSFQNYIQNQGVSGQNSFYQKLIERGYYKSSNLQTFGERQFTNGNKYIGDFNNGKFDGLGLLISFPQLKWVLGNFKNGQLQKIIEANNKFIQNEFLLWRDKLRDIHERHRQRWIDLDIYLPESSYICYLLNEAQKMKATQIESDFQGDQQQRRQKLSKVQQLFIEGNSRLEDSIIKNQYLESQKDFYQSGPFSNNKMTNSQIYSDLADSNSKESQFLSQNPFKINLVKIKSPEHSVTSSILQSDRRKDFDEQQIEFNQKNNFSKINRQSMDKLYNQIYDKKLERQRQKLRLKQSQDQRYFDQLNSYLRQSPNRFRYGQIYYSPNIGEIQSNKRYGRIINKRHFNYKDPDDYIVHKWNDTPSQSMKDMNSNNIQKNSNYFSHYLPLQNKQIKDYRFDERYSPSKYSSKNQKSQKSFIENNYRYIGN